LGGRVAGDQLLSAEAGAGVLEGDEAHAARGGGAALGGLRLGQHAVGVASERAR
jgi:hypothetical protein